MGSAAGMHCWMRTRLLLFGLCVPAVDLGGFGIYEFPLQDEGQTDETRQKLDSLDSPEDLTTLEGSRQKMKSTQQNKTQPNTSADCQNHLLSTQTSITMTEDSNGSSSLVSSSVYCYCNHGLCCNRCGKPMKNRNDTKTVIESLYTSKRPARSNVFGNGPLLLSDVPESSKGKGNRVVLGIDEAGRGSVLGPMVYGMAYWSSAVEDKIPKSFNDSKQLTEEKRSQLFDEILAHEHIGFALRSLLPSEISRNMLRSTPYNLNEMSHDTAMILIRKLLNANVNVAKCYIDTVGNPAYYKRKLEREFPGLEFVVESKADANYAPCSAASVGTFCFFLGPCCFQKCVLLLGSFSWSIFFKSHSFGPLFGFLFVKSLKS